jgi:hypothetical protein
MPIAIMDKCNNPIFWKIEINQKKLKYQILELTKTFILNTRLIYCL